jgi:hypothetical protein
MECFNSEKYRLENKPASNETTQKNLKYHVNEINEKIVLTKKYRILKAHDPRTDTTYELDKLIDLKIIDVETGLFCLPDTASYLPLEEAISAGLVTADLIDQHVESSNESFEYFEENNLKISDDFNYQKNIRFNNLKIEVFDLDYEFEKIN